MNKEHEEMNEYEKAKLIAESKRSINEKFSHISKNDWKAYFQFIKKNELLNAISILLNAKREIIEVKCSFDNKYIDPYDMHKFLIYGEEMIPLNYDNVLAIIPNKDFRYFYEDQDITSSFASCIEMLGMDSYSGKIMYAGIVNEESACEGVADLNSTSLINETEIYTIDEQSPIWKRYFAESYRLYESEQYKLAFLHSFIGFEGLIEYLNGILYEVYLKEQNESLDFMFEHYDKSLWTPVNLIENQVLRTQSYQRLKHLEDENRKLINDKLVSILRYVNDLGKSDAESQICNFKFYEKLRNVLAHGDSYEREDLKKISIYHKYYNDKEKQIAFDLLYCDFFEDIGKLMSDILN